MIFSVIITLVCTKLVSDMYCFCFNLFTMLFCQHRTGQAHDTVPAREDPDNIGTPADLTIEPLKSGSSTTPLSTQPAEHG